MVAVLLAVVAFHGALFELVRRWTTQEEYSHGFLIPLIAAWLIWTRRDVLLASFGPPSWTGVLLILLAMLMHVVGALSAIFILSQLAFIVALLGITLAVGGISLLRAAFFPIIFLIFAIPLPYFIDANLSLNLQLISSQLGVFFIRLFGHSRLPRWQPDRSGQLQAPGRRCLQWIALPVPSPQFEFSGGISV